MSSGWRLTTIEYISAPHASSMATGPFGSSISSKYFLDSGLPVIRGANLSADISMRLSDEGLVFVSPDKVKEFQRSLVRRGDLIFTCWGTINQVGLIDGTKKYAEYVVSNKQMKLTVDPMKADSRYIYYVFSGPDKQTEIIANGIGSSVPGFNLGQLKKHTVLLPPLNEQIEIADLLESFDRRITLLRETNATLEAIAQALFKSWFVDFDPVRAKMEGRGPEGMDDATAALFPDGFEESAFGPLPTGWKVNRLGDVVKRITKGTTPTTLKRKFVEAGINFVKAESMTDDGGFLPDKFAFIDNDTHDLLGRSQLNSGDVLISIAGTIGRVAVMTEEFLPANTNQAVALIRPIQDRLPSGLISRFLQRDESRQMMGERVVQAVQANLSLGTLSDLPIVLPPPAVTSQLYQSGMAQVDACKSLNSQKIRTLATLRDTLLPRLISGQLRLPETLGELEAADAV